MHRVVTDTRNHRGVRLLEAGPWHPSKTDAENWAEILRDMGYKAHIERMGPGGIAAPTVAEDNDDFASALASMV